MPVLLPTVYDERYFEGNTQDYYHSAGYGSYRRLQYPCKGWYGVPIEESTGTRFGDMLKSVNIKFNNRFARKKLLVLGCGYGFEVEALRDVGVLADGIDVSPFAISQASPEVAPYLQVQNAITYLATLRKFQYDYIFSRYFLECMSDMDLATLIPLMNKVCKNDQLHIMSTASNPDYYNVKPLNDWVELDFNVGTILVVNDDFDNYVTKINQ